MEVSIIEISTFLENILRILIIVIALFVSGCSTLPKHSPKMMVHLIAWDVSPSETCAVNAISMDNRQDSLGLGLAYWPDASRVKNRRDVWFSYGAEVDIIISQKKLQSTCVSLHKRFGVNLAGPPIFAARLNSSEFGIEVERLEAAPGQSQLTSVLKIRPFRDDEPSMRVDWDMDGVQRGPSVEETRALMSFNQIRILVAVAEPGATHQLDDAIVQLMGARRPDVTARPPRR